MSEVLFPPSYDETVNQSSVECVRLQLNSQLKSPKPTSTTPLLTIIRSPAPFRRTLSIHERNRLLDQCEVLVVFGGLNCVTEGSMFSAGALSDNPSSSVQFYTTQELTTWVTAILQKQEVKLKADLKKSIADGYTLPLMLSILFEDFDLDTDRFSSTPSQHGKFEQIRYCFEYLKKIGCKCDDINVNEVVNGDLKSVIKLLSSIKNFTDRSTQSPSFPASLSEQRKEKVIKFISRDSSSELDSDSDTEMIGRAIKAVQRSQTDMTTNVDHNQNPMDGLSVSDKLKWLLQDDLTTAVNVDSGEKEVSPSVQTRDQPSGESDSATSHKAMTEYSYYCTNSVNGRGYVNNQMSQSLYQPPHYNQPPPPYHKTYNASTMQHSSPSRQPLDLSSINKSVPNLHHQSTESPRFSSRPNTPTSTGRYQLSVHADQRETIIDKPLMYESVPMQRESPSKQISPMNKDSPSGYLKSPDKSADDDSAGESIAPDEVYSCIPPIVPQKRASLEKQTDRKTTGNAGVRRLSAPAMRYQPASGHHKLSAQVTAQRYDTSIQEKVSPRSLLEEKDDEAHRDNNDDDTDYVDIDDESSNEDQPRTSTPPLPLLMDDNTDTESCLSDNPQADAYKYRRSVSASGLMLSSGVKSFQDMMRKQKALPKAEEELTEEPEVDTSKPTVSSRVEQRGVVKPMIQTNSVDKTVNQIQNAKQAEVNVDSSESDSDTLNVTTEELSIHSKSSSSKKSVSNHPPVAPRKLSTSQNPPQLGSQAKRRVHSKRSSQRKPQVQANSHKPQPTNSETEKHQKVIDEKVNRLEQLYEDITQHLHSKRNRRHSTRRSSIASVTSSQYSQPSYAAQHRRYHRHTQAHVPDVRAIHRRFQKLESHIVTLAKSVAHLSSEIKAQHLVQSELERFSQELQLIKHNMNKVYSSLPTQQTSILPAPTDVYNSQLPHPNVSTSESPRGPQRINKLTRFFGQEPPLMKIFLRQLGYEKYLSLFDAEKIGMIELPYMTEEQLKSIGIPLGPRIRILQEASRLCPVAPQSRNSSTNV